MEDQDNLPLIYFLVFLFVIIIIKLRTGVQASTEEDDESAPLPVQYPDACLTYKGYDLNFSVADLIPILEKHFIYYTKLTNDDKEKFLSRLQEFISKKTFVIHDESGFKEMPVLISATAIQLSFGLDKYLLPHFSHIHIFPEEFIGISPTLRLLEGNVSGHCINLSWKHFLKGFQFPDDGQNVGLHEMAHAYYYQNFETGQYVSKDFVKTFEVFNSYGDKVLQQETEPGNNLYTDYGLRNMQEFWAESIELFFEKPHDLKMKYPKLYLTIKEILKQDPAPDLL